MFTSLKPEQVREAESLFRRVDGRACSLTFYLDYALTNYRDPVRQKALIEAVDDYLQARDIERGQGNLSNRQFAAFRCELRALKRTFPGKLVSELTPAWLTEFF